LYQTIVANLANLYACPFPIGKPPSTDIWFSLGLGSAFRGPVPVGTWTIHRPPHQLPFASSWGGRMFNVLQPSKVQIQ
jgi:hypothetical protein